MLFHQAVRHGAIAKPPALLSPLRKAVVSPSPGKIYWGERILGLMSGQAMDYRPAAAPDKKIKFSFHSAE